MDIFNWILGNREIFLLLYTIIIGIICFVIVLKTDKLFRLSFHQGIRYFRNAFFFYGLGFILRYLLGTTTLNLIMMKAVFEFFLIMAGFFLIYSLLWKKLDAEKSDLSSLFNLRILIFYLLTIIIVFLDYLWSTYLFMFISQIILFIFASIISNINYKKNKGKQNFLKLYFIVMLLNLIAWLLNFVIAIFFNWNRAGVVGIYLLNIFIFLLFLYGVIKVTKRSKI
jgi:hypothetical protein